MPVTKYRTFTEAGQALWNFNPDRHYYRQIHQLFAMAEKFQLPLYPSGIFKYKTLQEAQRQRNRWEVEQANAYKR